MKHLSTKRLCLSMVFSLLVLSGCAFRPFKFPVYQGNLLTNKQVVQVRNGMTHEQVQYLLGTPMLQDVFHPEEWHYVYYERQAYQEPVTRKMVIKFDNGRVVQIRREGWANPTV